MIPNIKKGATVALGIFVFLISKKYTKGAVNNKSNVIPIARLFGLFANIGDLAMRTINPIISNGIPKMVRFF